MATEPTNTQPDDIARWMLAEVQRDGALYQEHAVSDIARNFGDEFNYSNDSGNPAIDRRVLRAFKRLSADTVVWERGERRWCMRSRGDGPGRAQE